MFDVGIGSKKIIAPGNWSRVKLEGLISCQI